MRKPQAPRIARLLAIESFVDHNAARLPVAHASPAFGRLKEQISTLRELCSSEEELRLNGLAETIRYQSLRKTLIEDHLAEIVATAKSVLVTKKEAKDLSMPRGNPPASQFAGFARGMVAAAEENHKEALVAAGLAPDFAEQCRTLIAQMVQSHTDRDVMGMMRQGVSTNIAATLTDSRKVVKVIGIAVRKESRRDPALLSAWRSIAFPAQHAKLSAAPSSAALPSSESAGALANPAAPTMKLLPPTSEQPQDETPEGKGRPPILGPLGRLFGS